MSDATAVSILGKITSWYSMDSDLSDSHGSNTLDGGVTDAGHVVGKVGNALEVGSKGYKTIGSPVAVTPTTGSFTVGGWFHYSAPAAADVVEFGLTFNEGTTSQNEFLFIANSTSGAWRAFGWESPTVGYTVQDPDPMSTSYPITVRVDDAGALFDTSDQIIRIDTATAGGDPGWYFVVATWDAGNMVLYVDGRSVASRGPPAALNDTSVKTIQVGQQLSSVLTSAKHDELFVSLTGALAEAEVRWLYNQGAGRSYAQLVAAAA